MFFYILGYFDLFIYFIYNFFFNHVSSFSILKKFLCIVRSKIKKESWQLDKKQESYSKSKNVQRMPKKLKISRLKIHKEAGIKEKTQNLSKQKY